MQKQLHLCIYFVTVATQIQTVSRSDGHCSHPNQSVCSPDSGSAPSDDLDSPECQRSQWQDERQRQIPSEDLVT